MNSQIMKNDNILELGKTYQFAGYKWTACELINNGKTAVLQSHGVTYGKWPGYTMPQFGNGDYYGLDIDGQDISVYDDKMQALYDAIKDLEDTSASYGKGLYLISKEKAGFMEWCKPGSGNCWKILKDAGDSSSFGSFCGGTWLGTGYGRVSAWCVGSDGVILNLCHEYDLVIAPSFNLDLSKVEVVENQITKNEK